MIRVSFYFIFSLNIVNIFTLPWCDLCSPSEVLEECASPCIPEPTCQYRYPIPPEACILSCEARCECDASSGLIRGKEDGKCIPIADCADKCGPNQVYGCKPCCEEATCQIPIPPPCTKPCPRICIYTCICQEGYVRETTTGKCILEKNCLK